MHGERKLITERQRLIPKGKKHNQKQEKLQPLSVFILSHQPKQFKAVR
jgi:hypothetical protein